MLRHFAAGLLIVVLAVEAPAATFQVTRTDDPSPNGCAPADCSLREAMAAAAANDPLGPTDVILVPAGTISLTRGELTLVSQPLRVQGAGSSLTRIVQTEEFTNVFWTAAGADLAVVGMSLKSFRAPVDGCHSGFQGVPLLVDDVIFEGGTLQVCGVSTVRRSEIRTTLYANYGQTVVEDSAIRDFTVQGSGDTQLTLRRVLVDGEIDPANPFEAELSLIRGQLVIEDSTITHSHMTMVGIGPSTLTLRRVHYLDNTGPLRTETDVLVTIDDSLFEDNTARALYAAGGADWTVSGSSFVNNRVDGNAGGAIVLEDDTTLRIRNSTFSGNTFSVDAAADGARGAAVGFRNTSGAQLVLSHVTMVRPAVMPVGVVGTALGGHGNGIALSLSNSIVQGSCGFDAGVVPNNAGNVESSGDTCRLDPDANRINVSVANLALRALANNGGQTPTHFPAPASHAIDRASTPQCLSTDQRHVLRPGGLRCDAGAVEADGNDRLFASGFDP
ncbi:MAG: right-handed parallel beta-helix repeat-containing protein [Xanthomonadales bacterium]|nr:right-handed parallel beta-helix repeat-containing protein [Xanthomonadales bacterium]